MAVLCPPIANTCPPAWAYKALLRGGSGDGGTTAHLISSGRIKKLGLRPFRENTMSGQDHKSNPAPSNSKIRNVANTSSVKTSPIVKSSGTGPK